MNDLTELLDFEIVFDDPGVSCPACRAVLHLRVDFHPTVDTPPHCGGCGVVLAA